MSTPKDPADTFLGVSIADDPFAMLGLPRLRIDDAAVLAALGQRMKEVASHARSQTPEANELRLALHAAAAQLLDPQLQEILVGTGPRSADPEAQFWSPENEGQFEPTIAPPASTLGPLSSLSHDLLLVVAANGGWNSKAMRRIAMLAHARGIPSQQIPEIVNSVLASAASAPVTARLPEVTAAKVSETKSRAGSIAAGPPSHEPRKGKTTQFVITTLFALLAVTAMYLVWQRLTTEKQATVVLVDSQATGVTDPVVPTPQPAPAQIPSATSMSGIDGARAISRLASQHSPMSDEQLAEFRLAHEAVSHHWVDFDSDRIAAVHNSIIEIVYRQASDASKANAVIAIIGDQYTQTQTSPDELISSVWAAGTLSRLSIERNLPSNVDSAIIGRLTRIIGGSPATGVGGFLAGARVALDESSGRFSSGDATAVMWSAWVEVTQHLFREDQSASELVMLDAIESLMVDGPDPVQSRQTYKALEQLCGLVDFAKMSTATQRLVSWFTDDRITSSDLSVVMQSVVSGSAVPGVDESLVLSSGATDTRRMAVRIELESLLLGRDIEASEAIRNWVLIAEQELAKPVGNEPFQMLQRTVVLSNLSAAAKAALWGKRQDSEYLIANLSTPLSSVAPRNDGESSQYLGGDAQLEWATRYLAARQNIPIREAMLAELTKSALTIGPVAAEVIVRDAFLGTPATIRRQAQEVVRLHSDQIAIVNATFEYLPRIPKIESSNELIEIVSASSMPAVTDPNWSLRAREGIVERLLQLVAGTGEGHYIDRYVDELNESYAYRVAGRRNVSAVPTKLARGVDARALYEQWAAEARREVSDIRLGAMLDELEPKLVGRLMLAQGDIDRFATYQITMAETAAIVIEHQNPAAEDRIKQLFEEWSSRRRNSNSILHQIQLTEQFMVRLWRIRLEGGLI